MSKITFIESTLNPEDWDVVHSDSVLETLKNRYDAFPQHARIFAGAVTAENDVTPRTASDIDALEAINDDLYVIHNVADPVTAIIAVIAIVAVALYVTNQVPDAPELGTTKNSSRAVSPNNQLGNRANQGRPTSRIPDIYGRVKSTPDLLTNPYTTYENNIEFEHSLLAIGRGHYALDASQIFEDVTPISAIDGYTIVKYNPETNINSFASTAFTFLPFHGRELKGTNDDLRKAAEVYTSSSVTGQTLIPPNLKFYNPDNDANITDPEDSFIFISPNIVARVGSHDDDIQANEFRSPSGAFSKAFKRGDEVTITGSNVLTGGAQFDLNGTYTVDRVYQSTLGIQNSDITPPPTGERVLITNIMYLDNPSAENSNWNNLATSTFNAGTIDLETGDLTGTNSNYGYDDSSATQIENDTSVYFVGVSDTAVGFKMEHDIDRVICNYVAQNGIRGSNPNGEYSFDLEIETTVDLFDENNVFISRITSIATIEGTADGSTKAITEEIPLGSVYPIVRVFARRSSTTILRNANQIQDTVKWQDMYGLRNLDILDSFDSITTLMVRVEATEAALRVGNRRLNLWVERALPVIQTSGTTESTFLDYTDPPDRSIYSTVGGLENNRFFSNILIDMANDPYIGRGDYTLDLDRQNLYDLQNEIEAYFGSVNMTTFNFTFDKNDMVFEEMVSAVARAVFCQAFREGNKIILRFDNANVVQKMLFNHRNKLPKSEKRSIRFANDKEYDGVEIEYVDEGDGSSKTIRVPDNITLFKPKKSSSIGILGRAHAYFHANREFNRIRYQNTTVQFTATQEAATLVENDLILVSDNTRAVTLDGEVLAYDTLTYTLSQPIKTKKEIILGVEVDVPIISPPATLFIQKTDQTIESANIVGINEKLITVDSPPTLPLVTNSDRYARTTYQIVPNNDTPINEFQVTKISTSDNWTFNISAINHTNLIYQNDTDLINGVINEDGEIT